MKKTLFILIAIVAMGGLANSEQFRVCMLDDCQGTCAPHCIPPTDPK